MSSLRQASNAPAAPNGVPTPGTDPTNVDSSPSSATAAADGVQREENLWDEIADAEAHRRDVHARLFQNKGGVVPGGYNDDTDPTVQQLKGLFKSLGLPVSPAVLDKLVKRGVVNVPQFKELSTTFSKAFGQDGPGKPPDPAAVQRQVQHIVDALPPETNLKREGAVAKTATSDAEAPARTPEAAHADPTSMDWAYDDKILLTLSASALVFLAMLLAMKENNAIKGLHLNDIQKFNTIGQQMNKYMTDVLTPAQQQLEEKQTRAKDDKARNKITVSVERRTNWDLDTLWQNPDTKEPTLQYDSSFERASSQTLSAMIKEFEQARETLSNKREQASNAFQSADQRSQQCFNMLVGFLKNYMESISNVIKNSM